jgi:hypothetical protein
MFERRDHVQNAWQRHRFRLLKVSSRFERVAFRSGSRDARWRDRLNLRDLLNLYVEI